MSSSVYINGVLREWWNDAGGTVGQYSKYDASGQILAGYPRDYTQAERDRAAAEAAATLAIGNEASTRTKLAQDFLALQTQIAKTNSQLQADFTGNNIGAMLKEIYRPLRRLTRIALSNYDGSD